MSVTVSIAHNWAYCREFGLVNRESCACGCEPGESRDDCEECGGTGVFSFETVPFELNLTNDNFAAVWDALGLAEDFCGQIDGRTLTARLDTIDAEAIVQRRPRDVRIDRDGSGPRCTNFGIRPVQAERYIDLLGIIGVEAQRREEPVVWG